MNLAEQLDLLADDLDLPTLPEPGAIVRAGDRRRARNRRRVMVAVAAAIAAVLAMAINTVDQRSALQPANEEGGWRVTRTIAVPGSGVIAYADGSLWVGDDRHGTLTPDGMAPAGILYQVDPASGRVLDRVPGVVGGWTSVGGGYLWACTLAQDLNVLTRVDLRSHQVTQLPTAASRTAPHGTAYVAGKLWVANADTGDLVAMDPHSGDVVQTVHVGNPDMGETPFLPRTDGTDLWFSTDSGEIWRYDGATGKPLSRLGVTGGSVRLIAVDTSRRTMYAVDYADPRTILEVAMDQHGTWHGRKLTLSAASGRGQVDIAAVANGVLWVVTDSPDELLLVDPASLRIRERLPLTGVDHTSANSVNLTSTDGTVWLRIRDKVLALTPAR